MSTTTAPLSSKAKRSSPTWFFVLFGFFGFLALIPVFLLPLVRIVQATTWKETPCTILSSQVGRHSGKSTTYSIDIAYRYSFDGIEYTAKRYHFVGGSSSGYKGKDAVVKRYRPGSRAVCYVNPRAPSQAVINRGFTSDMWFGLIPLVFMAVGYFGATASRRAANRPASAQWQPAAARWLPADPRHDATHFAAVPLEPRELRPSTSPLAKLGIFIVFALAFNGVVVLLISQIIHAYEHHHMEWGLALFCIPFALAGIGFFIAVISCFLALFNPRIHLTVTPGAVPLGEKLAVEWIIRGRADKLTRLRFVLEGREEATYQNGKNTSTARNVFHRTELVTTTDRAEFASGHATITIPRNTMHSLDTGSNRITWVICAEGEIPRWPDIKDDYPLVVLPMRKEALAAL